MIVTPNGLSMADCHPSRVTLLGEARSRSGCLFWEDPRPVWQVNHKRKRSQQRNDSLKNVVTLCAYYRMADHRQFFYTVSATRVCSKSKLGKPLRANSSPRGKPTYPNPMKPICTVLLSSFERRLIGVSTLACRGSFVVIDSPVSLWVFDSGLGYYRMLGSIPFLTCGAFPIWLGVLVRPVGAPALPI